MTATPAQTLHRLHLAYTTFLHSGDAPCRLQALGLSDQEARGTIRELRRLGLELQALRGQGHRLRYPLAPLHADALRAQLLPAASRLLQHLELHFLPDSTNTRLAVPATAVGACVILAEGQTRGRGRRGDDWYSPLGAGVYLSIGWPRQPELPPAMLAMLPAVAIMRALRELGIQNAGLKWPNDILLRHGDDRKLGGILAEARTRAPRVVIGIGLNVRLPETGGSPDYADLVEAGWAAPSRSQLIVALLNQLLPMLDHPPAPAALADDWNTYDCTQGHDVTLQDGEGSLSGTALGVDAEGQLLLRDQKRIHKCGYGTLRLSRRAAPAHPATPLLADLGNSRLKWMRYDHGPGPMAVQACDPTHPAACFDRAWSALHPPPSAIHACNVAGPAMADALCNWVKRNWGTPVHYARSQRRFGGIVNGYRDYRRLGIDRWLAMLAAWQHSGGRTALCVIDIGTATTVDVVDPHGYHQGGLILPGPTATRGALLQRLPRLPAPEHPATEGRLGVDTRGAVECGLYYATSGALGRIAEDIRGRYAEVHFYVCGGGAAQADCLVGGQQVPELILQGLATYFALT